ncbi:unnamed protein product [Agarophyton chilense]|eukprot:gb/GEZJ01001412.1/.p1 GENE.gb/GEZJ01001412.1/~~gb/GEZJ01001412.1/.p1  ORF type:complete len:546 (-),score=58.56 gb/GEZJ01001412.1/:2372-4009(-)
MKTYFLVLCAALLSVALGNDGNDFIKINVGGTGLEDIGFLQDESYFYDTSTGDVQSYSDPGFVAPDEIWGEVYRTHRFAEGGSLTYRFPVPDGQFKVGLMFMEQFDGAARAGGRIMDLFINGEALDKGIDVWSSAGGKLYAPYFLQKLDIASVDGYITITLDPVVENPMLSGVVIEGEGASSVLWNTVNGVTPTPMPLGSAAPPTPVAAATSGIDSPASFDVLPSMSSGVWSNVKYNSGNPTPRHEACAVFAGGLLYSIGGRGKKDISVYNPVTKTWSSKSGPPVEINHMQCVYYDKRIWIGGSWYGVFPMEKEHEVMWVYHIASDSWSQKKGLAVGRRRGGGAFVEHEGKMYMSHGAIGGHGAHAVSTGLFDVYDPATDAWRALKPAPNARDHTTGAMVNGKLCVGGGRDGGQGDFWSANVGPIDCYNFGTGMWEVKASLPVARGGTMVGTTCSGLLMIAGGEGKTAENKNGQAFDRVDFFREETNSFEGVSYMTSARHGSGLGISSCECGHIYVPSGSAGLGGGPEVSTTDVWTEDGVVRECV